MITFLVAGLALAASLPPSPAAPVTPPALTLTKILVEADGVYRVTDAALSAAGSRFPDAEVPRLRLTRRGVEVPIRLSRLDPGSPDGRFAFEFLGTLNHGRKTWEDEYTRTNVYLLGPAPQGQAPRRFQSVRPGRINLGRSAFRDASPFPSHQEVNKKLIRFVTDQKPDENWFWQEIKATDPQPTRVKLTAPDLVPEGSATLRVRLVGYSHLPADPDHTVDVALNDQPLGKAVFDGESAYVFEKVVEASLLKEGENVVSLRALGETTNGIDLVLLDWIELVYPRRHRFEGNGQLVLQAEPDAALRLADAGENGILVFDTLLPRVFELRTRDGFAYFRPGDDEALSSDYALSSESALSSDDALGAARLFRAVRAGEAPAPAGIQVSHPLDWKAAGLGADFVIVSHRTFLPAARRLAAARAREGLSVQVVDVADVYDVFNDGFLSPEAIRDLLKHAWASWSPRPRYVLLFGDASWDYKNTQVADENYADWHWSEDWAQFVPKNASNSYRGQSGRNDRQLVPTLQYQSPWGHAASDHYFACVSDEKQWRGDLAVGRLPVATAAEAEGVVDKILAYEKLPLRKLTDAVFVSNDEPAFQSMCDDMAQSAPPAGYKTRKIYPRAEEKDNRENTKALLKAFDSGPALVVFNGHGGRYIWRTGPPDLKKNHDLFTLDHLDELKKSKRLPVVVSLTCYSAPFDHPVADSIGEKLVRMPDRGAVAVVASSWRGPPPVDLGRMLLEYLADPRYPRVGDAFLEGIRNVGDRTTQFTYNLLGDPTTTFRGPLLPERTGAAEPPDGRTHAGSTPR